MSNLDKALTGLGNIDDPIELRLTFMQKLRIRLGCCVVVGYRQEPDWKGPIPVVAFNCPNGKHGLVTDTIHGRYAQVPPWSVAVWIEGKDYRADCLQCKKEILKK